MALAAGLALILAVVAVVGFGAGPAAAHGSLLQASPGVGQQAGGTINFVDLAFLETVNDVVMEVTHNGAQLAGTMEEATGRIIRLHLDQPLSDPGRYDVTYTLTSADGDRYSETYHFTFEPASPQAFRLGSIDAPPSAGGWTTTRIIASVVLVGAMAGLAFLYLSRLESRRSAALSDESVDDGI